MSAIAQPATSTPRDAENTKRENLRRVFDSLDSNNDGSLDFHDLQQGFRKAGVNINDEQVRKMIEVADDNKNQKIEFDEFYKYASGANSHSLDIISEYWLQYSTKPIIREAAAPAWKLLFAGGVAGAVSRTCTSPLERLKILNQVRGMQLIGKNEYNGVIRSLVQMVEIEGVKGLFKGNGTNVIRIAPYSAIQFMSYERYKKFFLKRNGNRSIHLTPVQNLLAGGCAGVTSLLFTYPLDLIRSRLTIQTTQTKYNGIMHTFDTIVKEEGYRGLYKGMLTSIMGVAPYVAINFTTYETLKRTFVSDHRPPTVIESLMYGAVAGATAQTATYPIDLLRRRLQLQGIGGQPILYTGPFHALRTIVRDEGITALYRGMIPCYLKVVPAISISFCTYELMRLVLGIESRKVSSSSSF
jgi:solute carrier family 25 phosphate transporter 23/24/25/41